MTTVTISMIENRVKVCAVDHAYGSNLVCAATSILMFTLEAWLLNHSDYVKKHKGELKPGKTEIEFIPVKAEVYDILGFLFEGLDQLEHSYGEFLSVNVSEALKTLIR